MKRIEHLAMIAHDMGLIFEFLGIVSFLPFLVLVIFGEWNLILPMATAPVTFLVMGFLISHVPYEDLEPSFSVTLSAVALSWLAIAFIGALPFVFGMHMSYTDSIFEAMSGWTGTAFSMIPSLASAFRQGTFTAISGLCTCGLQNSDPHYWASIPLAIVTMMVFIGSAMGSTAGGVKVNRLVLVYDGVKWWFRRFFVSSRVLVPLRFGGRTHSKEISELAISKNLLVIIIYVLTIFFATILSLHLYITSFRLDEVVFEIVSALSNAGLTVGFISEASPLAIKWMFIILMWLGRLEIVPVIIIAMGIVKEILDDIASDQDTGDAKRTG
jgi:Trk-type K+ transport system membrane component